MATAAERAQKKDLGPDWRETLAASIRAFRACAAVGAVLIGLAIALGVALVTHNSVDPSFTTAAGGPPTNWLGAFGAYASDALLFLFGPAAALFLPLVALVGPADGARRRYRPDRPGAAGRGDRRRADRDRARPATPAPRCPACPPAMAGRSAWPAPMASTAAVEAGRQSVDRRAAAAGADGHAGAGRLRCRLVRARHSARRKAMGGRQAAPRSRAPAPQAAAQRARCRRRATMAAPPRRARARRSPSPTRPGRSSPAAKAGPKRGKAPARPGQPRARRQLSAAVARPARRAAAEKPRAQIDRAGLERNARLLESVLEDFHVRGDIVEVRPGPVVTMYELEPASGIKASRVIQLADDIARNMSALSARVATIPGRSVIGIELPNPKRETVALSELIGSQAFEDQNMSLPLILGKNIAGDPVIADLAPMPHLLVAGTTGSGKSVGLNCMILSLLYRMSPDQCRLIMIDPEDARTQHLRRHPAPARAGRDRAGQGDPRAQMDRRADGGALPDDGQPRRPPAGQLQRQGARRQGQGRAARAAGADRLRRRHRPAGLRDRGAGI